MNAVTTTSKASNVKAALAALNGHTPLGQNFMKFNGSTGHYTYGRDEEQLHPGTLLAIDMSTFASGWIFWKDSKPETEIMAVLMNGEIPVKEHELPPDYVAVDDEDGWSKQAAVNVAILHDNNTSEEAQFKISSASGLRSMGKLFSSYAAEMVTRGEDAIPVVEIDAEQFTPKEKKHGKKYAPILKIVEWTTAQALAEKYPSRSPSADAEDDPASYAPTKEAPKAIAAPKAEVVAEATPEVAVAETPAAAPTPGARRRKF